MKLFHNYIEKASFIQQDEEIFSCDYEIISFSFKSTRKILTPLYFFLQLYKLVFNFYSYKTIVSHMAGFHTFLPSILSMLGLKNHVIILHGTECNVIEEINYGLLNRRYLRWVVSFSVKKASLLLPVSEYLIYQQSDYLGESREMGLKSRIKDQLPPYRVIHNGIDGGKIFYTGAARKNKSFLTIASGLEVERRYLLKGIDLLISLAKDFPECHFTIIGSKKIFGYDGQFQNISVIDFIENEKLNEIISSHTFYLQLSMSEGFGIALCEAMLCGLVPIVSNVGMMPEIIGDTGYILPKRDYKVLKELVSSILLNQDSNKSQLAAQRIKELFPVEKRKNELLRVIGNFENGKDY